MIDFTLSESQKMLQTMAHDFAEKEIRPFINQWDKEPDPVKASARAFEVAKKGMKLGFGKVQVPEKWGGYGGGAIDYCVVFEELAWGDPGIASAISVSHGCALQLAIDGNEEQKKKWLQPYCEDESGEFLLCGSMTEPVGGSEMLCPLPDPALGMRDKAIIKDGMYVINGSRSVCTNGARARVCLISLRTDATKPNWDSIADFVIPMNTPGISVGRAHDLTGFRGAMQNEVHFDNVRVPLDSFVAKTNIDWGAYLTSGYKQGIRAAGLARAAYEEALRYATERIIWGQRLRDHEYISGLLVDMKIKIENLRSLCYRMAWAMDNRADSDGFFKLLPMPFIYSAQVVREVTGDALNILGFYGATKESLVEKCCRDALVVGITDGGATLHKYFLAKRL